MNPATATASLLLVIVASTASAQTPGPYVTGFAGVSGGNSGTSFAGGGAVGYMSPRRLGFELEIAIAPGLDFIDDTLPRIQSPPFLNIFPAPTLRATGRVLTFQSNVVAALTRQGPLQVSIAAGGGVANRQQDITLEYASIVFTSGLPTFPFLDLESLPPFPFPLEFEMREQRSSRSDNALCLNAGGIVEYALSSRLSAGADVRYTHAFFSTHPWDTARVTARVRWQF